MTFQGGELDHYERHDRRVLKRLKARRDPSDHTVRAYRSDLRHFLAFAAAEQLDVEDGQTIFTYVLHLSDSQKRATRTIRRRVSCLRGFFKDLKRTGGIGQSPCQQLEMQLPRAKSLPRAIAQDDAIKLTKTALKWLAEESDDQRDMAIAVLLLLSVSLRAGELVQLKSSDFDPLDGALHVRGKGHRERRVPIVDPKLLALLTGLTGISDTKLFAASKGSWSTQTFRQRLSVFAIAAGLKRKVTPHMLRHTSATLLLEDGVDLLFLQRMLDHKNIATTALYAHVGDASLKRALTQASLLTNLAA